jgi:hypothetical protein
MALFTYLTFGTLATSQIHSYPLFILHLSLKFILQWAHNGQIKLHLILLEVLIIFPHRNCSTWNQNFVLGPVSYVELLLESNAIQTIMKLVLSLSIVCIAFGATKIRRIKRALLLFMWRIKIYTPLIKYEKLNIRNYVLWSAYCARDLFIWNVIACSCRLVELRVNFKPSLQ